MPADVRSFLESAFRACDPLTMAMALVSGVLLGFAFLRAFVSSAWLGGFSLFISGSVFIAFVSVGRLTSGSVTWSGWIGVWVLWCLFSLGAYLSLRSSKP